MTDTTRALVLKAKKSLQSADLLRSNGDFDSAASRVYYSMFYYATAALLVKGYEYASHQGVLSGFGRYFVKTGEMPPESHRWLLDAFDKRQMGDYLPISHLDEDDVSELLTNAESFNHLVEGWLQAKEQG